MNVRNTQTFAKMVIAQIRLVVLCVRAMKAFDLMIVVLCALMLTNVWKIRTSAELGSVLMRKADTIVNVQKDTCLFPEEVSNRPFYLLRI